jgi:hypothetical protein
LLRLAGLVVGVELIAHVADVDQPLGLCALADESGARPRAMPYLNSALIELGAHAGSAAVHRDLADPSTCEPLRQHGGGRVVHVAARQMSGMSAST